MAYRVRILPAALQDAKDCYLYIAAESPDTAIAWFEGLLDAIDSLAIMPNRCAVAPEAAIIGREIRVLVYRKHYRILFCVEKEVVRIYHIQHSARAYLSRDEFLVQPPIEDDGS